MCGDLGCGAITVGIDRDRRSVTWRDFRMENGYTTGSEMIDLSALGPFIFDANAYKATLLAPTGVLDALEPDERAAQTEWKARQGLRGAINRLRCR